MKVLIVCGAGIVSGKEVMTLELSQGLKTDGLDIQVLTSTWGNGAFPMQLHEAGLKYSRLPLGFISATLTLQCINWTYGQLQRWPELLRGYKSLLEVMQPNKVIHTNWHHLLLLLPFLHSKSDLFWLHEIIPDKWQYRAVFQMFARRLQYFVPVSYAVAESLKRIGIPERKIRVIHNGLTDLTQDSERIPVKSDIVRLGIVGQIGSWKGHGDLLEAFGQVGAQYSNLELHVFGRGGSDYEQQLKLRALELNLANRIIWHDFESDRAKIYDHIDICVVPSRSEDPLPTSAIEAASFGLPVIATRKGGLPEIIEDGVTGILVPPEDPHSLADGIIRLLVNADLRCSMGLKARARMLTHFSSTRFIDDFLALLQQDLV